MSDEIKPCPFCGDDQTFTFTEEGDMWQVYCEECEAHSGWYATEGAAVEAWNRPARVGAAGVVS